MPRVVRVQVNIVLRQRLLDIHIAEGPVVAPSCGSFPVVNVYVDDIFPVSFHHNWERLPAGGKIEDEVVLMKNWNMSALFVLEGCLFIFVTRVPWNFTPSPSRSSSLTASGTGTAFPRQGWRRRHPSPSPRVGGFSEPRSGKTERPSPPPLR